MAVLSILNMYIGAVSMKMKILHLQVYGSGPICICGSLYLLWYKVPGVSKVAMARSLVQILLSALIIYSHTVAWLIVSL